jgi:hypothetical protein
MADEWLPMGLAQDRHRAFNQHLREDEAAHVEFRAGLKEIHMRLENGRKHFDGLDKRVSQLEPKRLDILRVIAIVVPIVAAILGGWWYLSESLAERPTAGVVHEEIMTHAAQPHPATGTAVRSLSESLIEVRTEQKMMRGDVTEIKADVKALIRGRRDR